MDSVCLLDAAAMHGNRDPALTTPESLLSGASRVWSTSSEKCILFTLTDSISMLM